MKNSKEKGITLIALVITIIILLILAGISIASLTGSGLFGRAKDAKQKSENGQEKENITLSEYENELDKYTSGSKTYKAYNIGDEVTVGNEKFYVIKTSGTNEEKVTLLAAKNIDTNTMKQSENANQIAFSSTDYWGSVSPDLDLNNYQSESIVETDAIEIAKTYGGEKGGIGRLITIEEIYEITGLSSTGKISSPDWIITTNYWSSALKNGHILAILNKEVASMSWYMGGVVGVRPVIEISKSSIQ